MRCEDDLPKYISDHSRSLSKVLLHKFRSDDADERGCGVVSNSLGQHGLATAGRTVHQDAARRVNTDLILQGKL